jgi:glycosyltransferase involved in cell wall biosynthesis
MKIVSLTSLFPNNMHPDSCVFIRERLRYLSKIHDLKVVAPVPYFPRIRLHARWYRHSQTAFRERIGGMDVFHPRYVVTPRVGMAFYGLGYFLSIISFMKKLSRRYPFRLVDAHYIYPDGLGAVLVARTLRKPVVLSARGSDINLFTAYPVIRRWIVYALTRCDRIIAVSEALKDAIVGLGLNEGKIDVIPNGVDADQFHPVSRAAAREALGLPPAATILLSVGSLRSLKGFHHLISAVDIIRGSGKDRDADLRLYIIGSGEYRGKLEQRIARLNLQSHVRLVGQIPHGELYQWYNAADLFVLASSREGWPNVIMESLACGLPVVATPVGGIPEILHSGKYGLLLDAAGDSGLENRLAESILEALSGDWDRQELVAYARRNSWDRTAGKIDDTFRRALKDHG